MSSPYQPYPQDPSGGYGQPLAGDPGPGGYLRGAPVGFGAAITEAFKSAFNYNGRASRSAYWWFALFDVIASIVLILLAAVLKDVGVVILILWYIVSFFITLSLAVRRLHDSNRSGAWYLIVLVPLIGGIWLLVLLCQQGTPGPNRWG